MDAGASDWMARGSELEAEAVAAYEFEKDAETVPVGFVTTDDGRVGCSPDRLVGADGLLEIKCPSAIAHVGNLLAAPDQYAVQVQGQLWVAEREYCDLLSYCPGLPRAMFRIYRDDAFISKMAAVIAEFCDRIDAGMSKIDEAK